MRYNLDFLINTIVSGQVNSFDSFFSTPSIKLVGAVYQRQVNYRLIV